VPEVVYVQHLMGVDGVIVDLVREIAEACVDVHGHGGSARVRLPGRRRHRGGREDGDGCRGGGRDAELLAAGDVLPPEAHSGASAVACCSCWRNFCHD